MAALTSNNVAVALSRRMGRMAQIASSSPPTAPPTLRPTSAARRTICGRTRVDGGGYRGGVVGACMRNNFAIAASNNVVECRGVARSFRPLSSGAASPPVDDSAQDDDYDDDDYDDDEMSLREGERRLLAYLASNPTKRGLRPSAVRRRIDALRTYEGRERNIRHSPWRLNLVCQFAAGQPVTEALRQLAFNNKGKAPLVAKVIQRTANLASIRDGLRPSQLEVAECFSTHAPPLKRVQFMAKGRMGKKYRRHSHMNVKLREIDFDLKVVQARSTNQRRRWLARKRVAERDVAAARRERDEMEALEEAAAKVEGKRKRAAAEAKK